MDEVLCVVGALNCVVFGVPIVKWLFKGRDLSPQVKQLIDKISTCKVGKYNKYTWGDTTLQDETALSSNSITINDINIMPNLTRREVKAVKQAIHDRKVKEIGALSR